LFICNQNRKLKFVLNQQNIEYRKEKIKGRKCTTANERFHASGGVARPIGSATLQVLCPAQTAVSRRLREAATTLSVILGQSASRRSK
jgi:hypothetical protein